jgi:hypothetical protein
MLASDGHIKICGLDDQEETVGFPFSESCGLHTDFHSSQSDWSPLRALMYEMLTGGAYPSVSDATKWPVTVSELAKDLMTRVSELPVADIKAHAWFGVVDWSLLETKRINSPYIPDVNEYKNYMKSRVVLW